MLILSQSKKILVNMDRVNSITVYDLGYDKFRILVFFGSEDRDYFGIGDYKTEERAKEILVDIMRKYTQYFHRPASPAILNGSADIPEAVFVFPKVYEMPEV